MKKIITTFLLLILVFTLFLTGCTKKTTTKIRLNEVTHSVFYAPLYAAINLGYFGDNGIEIELTNGGGADKTMTALLAGEADIGFAGPESAVYVYKEKKDDYAVVIGQITKRDGSLLMGRAEEPNFKWENLKGKSVIGGRPGGVPLMSLMHALRENNINPDTDLEIITNIQFNLMAGAFIGGTGDYVTVFEPTASEMVKAGQGHIVASVGSASGEIPFTTLMVKKTYIESNSELIQKFMDAIYKGQKWVATHSPDEIAEKLAPSFVGTDIDILKSVAKNYKDADAWSSDPVLTEDAFNRLIKVMTDANELDVSIPYDKLVDNSFAQASIK